MLQIAFLRLSGSVTSASRKRPLKKAATDLTTDALGVQYSPKIDSHPMHMPQRPTLF